MQLKKLETLWSLELVAGGIFTQLGGRVHRDLPSCKGNRANVLSGKPLEVRTARRVKLRWI